MWHTLCILEKAWHDIFYSHYYLEWVVQNNHSSLTTISKIFPKQNNQATFSFMVSVKKILMIWQIRAQMAWAKLRHISQPKTLRFKLVLVSLQLVLSVGFIRQEPGKFIVNRSLFLVNALCFNVLEPRKSTPVRFSRESSQSVWHNLQFYPNHMIVSDRIVVFKHLTILLCTPNGGWLCLSSHGIGRLFQT